MVNSINNTMPIRNTYIIKTNQPKKDNTNLSAKDYINIGYMAGRFGVNLQNPNEPNPITYTNKGVLLDINSCTSTLFEENLEKDGIHFDKLA